MYSESRTDRNSHHMCMNPSRNTVSSGYGARNGHMFVYQLWASNKWPSPHVLENCRTGREIVVGLGWSSHGCIGGNDDLLFQEQKQPRRLLSCTLHTNYRQWSRLVYVAKAPMHLWQACPRRKLATEPILLLSKLRLCYATSRVSSLQCPGALILPSR
jgi:hypothetical protein